MCNLEVMATLSVFGMVGVTHVSPDGFGKKGDPMGRPYRVLGDGTK